MPEPITPDIIQGYEAFLGKPIGGAPAPAEAPSGLLSRTFQNLGNLPANIPNSLIGGLEGIANLGNSETDRLEAPRVPSLIDIPAATTTGEALVDAIAGKMVPDIAASLVPYAGISKLGSLAAAGKTAEAAFKTARATDIIGQAAAGGLIGAQYGPGEMVKQAALGGALGAAGHIPKRLDRVLPAAGVAAADAGLTYAATEDPNAAASAAGLDFLFALLPGQWHPTPAGKYKYSREAMPGAMAGNMSDVPLRPGSMDVGDTALFPGAEYGPGNMTPDGVGRAAAAVNEASQGASQVNPNIPNLSRYAPTDLRQPRKEFSVHPLDVPTRVPSDTSAPAWQNPEALQPDKMMQYVMGQVQRKPRGKLKLVQDGGTVEQPIEVRHDPIKPSMELSAEIAGLPIHAQEKVATLLDSIDEVDDDLLEKLRAGLRTAATRPNEFALLQTAKPEGVVLPWEKPTSPSEVITPGPKAPSPSEIFGKQLIQEPGAVTPSPDAMIQPVESAARPEGFRYTGAPKTTLPKGKGSGTKRIKKLPGDYKDEQGIKQNMNRGKTPGLPEYKRTEGGFASPGMLIQGASPIVGGLAGYTQGDTEAERRINAVGGVLAGAGGAFMLRQLLRNPLAKSEAGVVLSPAGKPGEKVFLSPHDGKPRIELSDKNVTFNTNGEAPLNKKPLWMIIDHPELFDRIPALRDVEVTVRPNSKFGKKGTYIPRDVTDSGKGRIIVDSLTGDSFEHTVLHELQHAIQDLEGFNMGTNSREAGSYQAYRQHPGELEAEAVARQYGVYSNMRKMAENPNLSIFPPPEEISYLKRLASMDHRSKLWYDSVKDDLKPEVKASFDSIFGEYVPPQRGVSANEPVSNNANTSPEFLIEKSVSNVRGQEKLTGVLKENGREVGKITGRVDGDKLRVDSSWVPEDVRGQGNGTLLYEKLLKQADERNLKVSSDAFVAEDAARIYESLKAKGYNVVKNPTARQVQVEGKPYWISDNADPVYTVDPRPTSPAQMMRRSSPSVGGYLSTHAATSLSGAIAGGAYGFASSDGDITTTLAMASLGAVAGYGGYKVLEGIKNIHPSFEIDKPKALAGSIKNAIKDTPNIFDAKTLDAGGNEVRGRGGVLDKFFRGMEHWTRFRMPEEIKTAWTQARGAGALVVETTLDALNGLRWKGVPEDVRNIANQFIDGNLIPEPEVKSFIQNNSGITHADWLKLPKEKKGDYGLWITGDRHAASLWRAMPEANRKGLTEPTVELWHLPKDARKTLMDMEEARLAEAIPDRNDYVEFLRTARRGTDSLQEMMAEGLPPGKLKDLVLNSTGQYITRTFRIFTDKNYRPSDEQIKSAMDEASVILQEMNIRKALQSGTAIKSDTYASAIARLQKSPRPEAAKRLEKLQGFKQVDFDGKEYFVDSTVADELDKFTNDDYMRVFIEDYLHQIKTSKEILNIGSKSTIDTTLLKERESLSPTFRELLGEYRDPVERSLQTINRLHTSAEASRFLSKLSEMDIDGIPAVMSDTDWNKRNLALKDKLMSASPEEVALLQTELRKLNAYVTIPKNLKYGLLKDSRVSRFVADQLNAHIGPWGVWETPIGRGLAQMNTVSKMVRAPYNPVVHIRNWWTMPMFAAIAKASPSAMKQGWTALRERNALYRELLEQGIITADQTRGEFREVFDDVFNGHYDSNLAQSLLKGHRKVLDAYRYPDAMVRAGAYIEAKSRYASKMDLPENHPDVIRAAVQWTDRRTMNYDNIAPAVMTARNLPFFNLFISYAAEMARLTKNLAIDAVKEKDVSALAILGSLAVLPEVLQKSSEAALSKEDRDRWARAQALQPSYNRTRYKIVLGKDDKGNFKYLDFTPLIITDNFNRTIKAAASGDAEGVWAANPVIGWENTPAFNIITEQIAGRDLRTQRKFRDNSPDRILSIAEELMPVWTPGVGYEWKKDMPPQLGGTLGVENTKTGRKEDIDSVLLRFTTGLNKSSVNLASVQRSAMAAAKSEIANERAYLNDILKSTLPEANKKRAIERYKKAVQMIMADYGDRISLE